MIADYRWFSISDTDVHEGQRFHFSLNNYTVPYILVYKKRNDLLCPLPLGLNAHHDTACADLADSEFMLKELNAQEERKVNAEKNEMEVAANDSSKKMIPTPVKRKRKCTSADQERKKTMRKNLDDNVKDALCSTDKKRKKKKYIKTLMIM